jgi:dihydrofolate reductase
MVVSMIAALAENRVIGSASGGIPWNLPRDRDHFRAYTERKWLLLGRKTYEEMEGWFTSHTPLILTGDPGYRPGHRAHRSVSSPAAAIDLARRHGVSELVICGGAGVFAAAIGLANRLVMTRIEKRIELADPVFFPAFETSGEWNAVYSETWPCDTENVVPMRLEIYQRATFGKPSPKNNHSPI